MNSTQTAYKNFAAIVMGKVGCDEKTAIRVADMYLGNNMARLDVKGRQIKVRKSYMTYDMLSLSVKSVS